MQYALESKHCPLLHVSCPSGHVRVPVSIVQQHTTSHIHLACAGDIVLLAPSWKALQRLMNLLFQSAQDIGLTCNIDKTVCMVFSPKCRRLVVADDFPPHSINSIDLKYVTKFKYLGHMINHDLSDDDDIKREIRNMFMRSNILMRRHSRSIAVKLLLFKAYYMHLYDANILVTFTRVLFIINSSPVIINV